MLSTLIDALLRPLLGLVPDRRPPAATFVVADPPPWLPGLLAAAAWTPPGGVACAVSLGPCPGRVVVLMATAGGASDAELEVAPGAARDDLHAELDAVAREILRLAAPAPVVAAPALDRALDEAGRAFEAALERH